MTERSPRMKIAIVDDDIQMHACLRACFDGLIGGAYEADDFSSGEDFLSAWKKGSYDLVILDIFMGGMTGVDVAREIRKTDKNVRIVFGTTSNEFASESYEVDACYYLLKPFMRDKIKAMLDRLDIAEMEKSRTVTLPDGTVSVLRDIIYADFASHKVTLHCRDGKNVTVRAPYSEIEPLLCAYPYFFSPYKGIVVNFHEVLSHTADAFSMSDETIIPISRRKSKEALEAYSSFRFDSMRRDGEK